jgi:endonuclease I/V8-like Glu-specific endopeptidase
MGQRSISSRHNLLDATAHRMLALLGETAARIESTNLPAGRDLVLRQGSTRSRMKRLTELDLLTTNPRAAVERRLRRIGVAEDLIAEASRPKQDIGLHDRGNPTHVGLERIIGRNELLAIRYLDQGQRAGWAVGRIVIRSSSGAALGFGTGSMISPRLLMTNNHVIDSVALATKSVVEFNYQLGVDGGELAKVTFQLRPDTFFATDPEEKLDLTIVAVSPAPVTTNGDPLASFGFNPLSADGDEILAGENVTIIQHPGGDLKQIALRENRVLRLPNTADRFLYYETDTAPGSSGAPVFNDQWEVVALHHSGLPERDGDGRILASDGQVWRREMGDGRIRWIANEGIRVTAIRDFLASLNGLTADQESLRDAVLDPPVRQWGDDQSAVQSRGRQNRSPASSKRRDRTTAGRTAPRTASIQPNKPVPHAGSSFRPAKPQSARQSAQWLGPFTPPLAADIELVDIEAAKVELERAAARPYYDPAADATDRKTYYSELSSTLSPKRLFDALCGLISSTHQRRLTYKPLVYVYPWVDLRLDGKILSVYSNRPFNPIELIERDVEIAERRLNLVAQFRSEEAELNPQAERAFFEALEARLPYNCEHAVPQSWFAIEQPMKGDLHHLFACESGCNSFRGDAPYFDFSELHEAVRSDCGDRDSRGFEPSAGKGPVARATLYFVLRYPGKINAAANKFTLDRLRTLLEWHKYPPCDYERHRNQAIFELQGNRNPLIDHPDWAESIDFTRGLIKARPRRESFTR